MFRFTKMHALGNDFVVIDGIAQDIDIAPDAARTIANRNVGIGCDQILVIYASSDSGGAFNLKIFNSDGSESAQCGNGARCVARFLGDMGYATGDSVGLRTSGGILQCTKVDRTTVCVAMGVPRFNPGEIPFNAERAQPTYRLNLDCGEVEFSALSIGNPHAVIEVPDVAGAPVEVLGPAIEHCPGFPERTNVEFMQVLDRRTIALRVHERGVGETSACGSGACAAVAAGRRSGRLDADVEVRLPGGKVHVEWSGEGRQVNLTGPTTYVFDGTWRSDE